MAPYDVHTVRTQIFGDALENVDSKAGERLSGIVGAGGDPWPPADLSKERPARETFLGPLTPHTYDEARVMDQVRYLSRTANKDSRTATRWTIVIYVAGAATAFLLAVSWRVEWADWAKTTAGVGAGLLAAVFSWREYKQWDASAASYRRTLLTLRAYRARWQAMPPHERDSPAALMWYAERVEDALAAENADWERAVKQAQQTLFDRYRGR